MDCMADRQLAFSILQLVALSLPAFAILLQMVVESDFPYTKEAVPITTASFGLFIVAGLVVMGDLVVTTNSIIAKIALGIVGLGMAGMLVGAALIGLQTEQAQRANDNGDQNF